MTAVAVERYLIKDACPHCGKPVYADEGYYSTTGAHADCRHLRNVGAKAAIAKVDAAVTALTGWRPKRRMASRGEGGSTKKLIALIQAAIEKHFDGADVAEVKIYLASPVWCQYRFDVQKFEGSALVDGGQITFGSWATVGELLKHTELTISQDTRDGWHLDISGKPETRRVPRGIRAKT